MRVLAVDVHEALAHPGEQRRRAENAVQIDAASARLRDPAAHDEFTLFFHFHARLFEQGACREAARGVGYLEKGFDDRFFRAAPNEVSPCARAQGEVQGVEYDGFSGARLAREDVQSRAEGDFQVVDDGEIRDLEQAEHRVLRSSARHAGGSPTAAFL